MFRDWPARINQGVEVCALSLPGREHRYHEPPIARFDQALQTLADAVQTDRPVAFFGHCLGALFAYELALRFHARLLIVSACRPPHRPPARASLNQLSDRRFLKAIGKLGGTPDQVLQNPGIVKATLPALRADFRLFQSYHRTTRTPVGCPLIAIGGDADAMAPPEHLLDWSAYSRRFEMRLFPGNHFYLHSNPGLLSFLQGVTAPFTTGLPS